MVRVSGVETFVVVSVDSQNLPNNTEVEMYAVNLIYHSKVINQKYQKNKEYRKLNFATSIFLGTRCRGIRHPINGVKLWY